MKKAGYGAIAMMAGALVLAGCGGPPSEEGDAADPAVWSECQLTDGVEDASGLETGSKTELTLGAFNGWDESFATSHLLKAVLEQEGYSVTVDAYEAAPAFAGVAGGDIDVVTDVWMPVTHPQYIEQFGTDLNHLGCWYDNAKLTIAVNDDSPAQSIADLPGMVDEYGGTLYGIEPGAGLTKTTKEEAIPTYGLEDFEFIESSTPAMLAQVDRAITNGDNIVVTLWRPHWAYNAWPMRDLEDPEGAMGGAEIISSAGSNDFVENAPKAAQVIKNLVLTDDELSELEDYMMSEEYFNGEDHDAAVAMWLEAHPDFADNLITGSLS